jgi:hypothetical protein
MIQFASWRTITFPVCICHKEFLVRSAVLEEGRALILFIGIRERRKTWGRSRRRRGKTMNSLLLAADVSAWQPFKVGGAVALGTGVHWGTQLK